MMLTETKLVAGGVLASVGAIAFVQQAQAAATSSVGIFVFELALSGSALITGIIALLRGHGNYWQFRGMMDQKDRDEKLRREDERERVSRIEQKLDQALEELAENRRTIDLLVKNIHLRTSQ